MADQKTINYNLLHQLTQCYGPSGHEQRVAAIILDQVKDYVDTTEIDALGNLIVRKKGQGKKIMIACHMDEVGVIVTHINDQGYLSFSPVGGVKSKELIAKRVIFEQGQAGVICQEMKSDEKEIGKLFIDIGATSEEEARTMVKEGDMAVFVGEFQETKQTILSKSLDDRVGCFIAMEVLKQIKSQDDLFFVFTVQEEVGARGAKPAAYAIEPDLSLIVDATISFDLPNEQEKQRTCINKGVAIKVMDRSIVVSPKIKNWMAEIAQKNKIPFQWEIIDAGGTDSGPVHLTKGGIPTGGLAVPVRHLHTGNEIVAKADIQSAINLLLELMNNPI